MGDFSQNGIVSTLHDFKTKSTEQIEKELLDFSKEREIKYSISTFTLYFIRENSEK